MVPYDAVTHLSSDVSTLYADLAGDPQLADALRAGLGDALVHHVVVGVTHQQPAAAGTLAETGPAMFFAPDQMRKRIGDWGRAGLDQRFADAWRSPPSCRGGSTSSRSTDRTRSRRFWHEVHAGRAHPRSGHVITL